MLPPLLLRERTQIGAPSLAEDLHQCVGKLPTPARGAQLGGAQTELGARRRVGTPGEIGRLPKRGDTVHHDGYSIRVESVRENRIEAVRIRHRTPPAQEASAA